MICTEKKYGDWNLTIAVDGFAAIAEKRINDDVLRVLLTRMIEPEYECFEGWWPQRPMNIRSGLGGLCLWCHRWTVFFEPVSGRAQAARRYPASEIDRKEVIERIKKGGKGSRITHMDVPVEPRSYHLHTIDRQVEAVRGLCLPVLYYHLPTKIGRAHV